MSLKTILQLGNPILWKKSDKIDDFTLKNNISELITDLKDTLASFRSQNGFGRAIAAPQIGKLQQIVFLNTKEFNGALINPVITWASQEQMELWDDCFSFPDLMVKVSRSIKIVITYQDEEGLKKELIAANSLSELLQHEIDHLHGILALERAISYQSFFTRKEWLAQKLN